MEPAGGAESGRSRFNKKVAILECFGESDPFRMTRGDTGEHFPVEVTNEDLINKVWGLDGNVAYLKEALRLVDAWNSAKSVLSWGGSSST